MEERHFAIEKRYFATEERRFAREKRDFAVEERHFAVGERLFNSGEGCLGAVCVMGGFMVGLLAPTGGKILFVFFFKKQKDLEGRRENGLNKCPGDLLLKILSFFIGQLSTSGIDVFSATAAYFYYDSGGFECLDVGINGFFGGLLEFAIVDGVVFD